MNHRSLAATIFASVLGAVILIGIGAAWRLSQTLTTRPGEETLRRYAPQTTAFALTIDLKPSSFEQGQALIRIQNALKREQLDARMQSSLHKLTKDVPVVQGILPYLSGSGAVLAWEKSTSNQDNKREPDFVLVFGVSSENDVKSVLQSNSDHTSREDGQTLYHLRLADSRSDVAAILSGHDLLVGEPSGLHQAFEVRQGRVSALASDASFAKIRKLLPGDANVLYYMSPAMLQEALKYAASPGHTNPDTERLLQNVQPACFTVTLRQSGLQFDSASSGDAHCLQPIRETAPLNLRNGLPVPAKPLGLFSISQPAKYVEAIEQALRDTSDDSLRDWNRGIANFEKESGIRFHEEVLPAFNGNVTVAAYPGPKPDMVDFLFVADTGHNARPAQLADRVRESIEREDHHLTFSSQKSDGATLWTLPDSWHVQSIGPTNASAAETSGVRIAQVDDGLLFATSSDMLHRAITAYHSAPPVSLDLLRVPAGSRSVFVLQPNRMLAMLTPHLEEFQEQHPGQAKITADDLSDLFGESALTASVGFHDSYFTGSMQIPLHYETAIKLAGKVWDEIDRENAPSALAMR